MSPFAGGRMRLVGVGLLLATFVAGALSGAAIDRVLMAGERDGSRGDRDREDRRSYVIDAIEMSADQRATIDAVLERRSERMRAIWREVEPRLDAVTDSARSEIINVLTPEQRAEYERMLEERSRRHRERSDNRSR